MIRFGTRGAGVLMLIAAISVGLASCSADEETGYPSVNSVRGLIVYEQVRESAPDGEGGYVTPLFERTGRLERGEEIYATGRMIRADIGGSRAFLSEIRRESGETVWMGTSFLLPNARLAVIAEPSEYWAVPTLSKPAAGVLPGGFLVAVSGNSPRNNFYQVVGWHEPTNTPYRLAFVHEPALSFDTDDINAALGE